MRGGGIGGEGKLRRGEKRGKRREEWEEGKMRGGGRGGDGKNGKKKREDDRSGRGNRGRERGYEIKGSR